MPLSSTQLDATASVPGSFVYSPAAGRVLSPGTQPLSVTFTPTDTVDYTTATDTVTINLVVNLPFCNLSIVEVSLSMIEASIICQNRQIYCKEHSIF
jgi:hypothetical protein